MATGYLYIETSLSHPGLIRLRVTNEHAPDVAAPAGPAADPAIRYLARFQDIDAAWMHAFTALKGRLLNLDTALFRASPEEAVAAVESIALSHKRVFLDPELQRVSGDRIVELTQDRLRHQRHIDRIWQAVGWIALAWLAFLALAGTRM